MENHGKPVRSFHNTVIPPASLGLRLLPNRAKSLRTTTRIFQFSRGASSVPLVLRLATACTLLACATLLHASTTAASANDIAAGQLQLSPVPAIETSSETVAAGLPGYDRLDSDYLAETRPGSDRYPAFSLPALPTGNSSIRTQKNSHNDLWVILIVAAVAGLISEVIRR